MGKAATELAFFVSSSAKVWLKMATLATELASAAGTAAPHTGGPQLVAAVCGD
jgi:hypothetical protein